MAAGLYAVHCFIPPHPGVTAATGTLGADVGRVILYGLIVAVPAMLAGYFWATWKGKKFPEVAGDEEDSGTSVRNENLPGALVSFIPVVVPILLIAVRAVLSNLPSVKDTWMAPVLITGDPSIALIIGLILALCIPKRWEKNELGKLMHQGIEKAGGILIIIGAGSAFGAVISALKIQDYLAEMEGLNTLGIFFPFLIALILKTAQGSSTVAIITAASIVLPFLPGLQLDTANGRIIAVLAMCAGSMAISHVNDAYFWVITNFSNQALKPMLRVYSLATICMAVTGILAVYILSLFIL
jgi:GntP family gluconate:H+ symporter